MKSLDDIGQRVIDAAFHLHRDLGPGLLETVYEQVLAAKPPLGFLINFGGALFKDNVRRIANTKDPLASLRLGASTSGA